MGGVPSNLLIKLRAHSEAINRSSLQMMTRLLLSLNTASPLITPELVVSIDASHHSRHSSVKDALCASTWRCDA